MRSLDEQLSYWAEVQANTPFLVEAETGATMTFAECAAAVRVMRRFLGSEPRAVALTLPGSIVCAVVWLSVLTGGHRLVPLAPDASPQEQDAVLDICPPELLIRDAPEEARELAKTGARIVTRSQCERLLAASAALPHASGALASGASAGYVYLHTSGTTGDPKWVKLDAERIARTGDAIRASHHLTRTDRGLCVLPFYHVNAPVVSLSTSLMAGSTVVIARHFSRSAFWQQIEAHRITWASIVPTIAAMLLQTERPAFLPGALRFIRTASAPLPVAVLQQFEAKFGVPLVETYGLSEAASTVAANPVPPGVHKPGSVGLPLGVEMRICHARADGEQGEPEEVPAGEIGEICVRGPSIISGYVGGADVRSFQQGWFRTGDLGRKDADGYIYITGRVRDVIIRGGENIAPRDVEEALLSHPLVEDAAVVGRPDPLYGEEVVAFVVVRRPWTAARQEALRAHVVERLPAREVPSVFFAVPELPRNRTGKVDRQVLRRQLLTGEPVAPALIAAEEMIDQPLAASPFSWTASYSFLERPHSS